MDREERIRERAHGIWEEEGCPVGRHEQHWHRACHEIDTEAQHGAAKSGIPNVPGNQRGPQHSNVASSSGLVGADPLDQGFPNAMGVDDLNVAGDLTDPADNRPSTGRSKLVGT